MCNYIFTALRNQDRKITRVATNLVRTNKRITTLTLGCVLYLVSNEMQKYEQNLKIKELSKEVDRLKGA